MGGMDGPVAALTQGTVQIHSIEWNLLHYGA